MRVCQLCQRRTMVRSVSTGSGGVVFTCACGAREAGGSADRIIRRAAKSSSTAAARAEKYSTYVRGAPHSRTKLLIDMECPKCGLDVALLRLGEEEVIIYVCECGWRSQAQKGAAAAEA